MQTLQGTVSHFNRASNHNAKSFHTVASGLFLISIEHQITTYSLAFDHLVTLFLISIEHQITTGLQDTFINLETVSHFNRASNHNGVGAVCAAVCTVSHFNRASNHNRNCFMPCSRRTVSHFNRASNHNTHRTRLQRYSTVSHFNRASNHNTSPTSDPSY